MASVKSEFLIGSRLFPLCVLGLLGIRFDTFTKAVSKGSWPAWKSSVNSCVYFT